MKYRCFDGYELEAENLREVAEKLWQSKFIPEDTIEEWMVKSAERAKFYGENIVLRTTSPEEHVEDWIKVGFLEKIED